MLLNYYLDSDKGLLTLHLTLPLDKPLDARHQEVQVDVYDPSFFVAFGFATESPVKLSGASIKGCTAEIKEPDTEAEKGAQALSEAFFSQLVPQLDNVGKPGGTTSMRAGMPQVSRR